MNDPGPAARTCTNCGCAHVTVIRKTIAWGQPGEIVSCRNCRRRWTRPIAAPAPRALTTPPDAGPAARPVPEARADFDPFAPPPGDVPTSSPSLRQAVTATATATEPAPVAYDPDPVRCLCPACGAKNPPVYKTKSKGNTKTRYHRCDACAHTFASVESQPSPA